MSRAGVGVVIPALNAAATIGAQLEALAGQEIDRPWEVVVVDNGSSDGTPELCETFADRLPLRVVHCPRPGTSEARNAGAAATTASLLLFCDADDVVATGWAQALVDALEEADAAGGAIDNELLNDYASAPHMPRHPDHLPVVAGFLPRAITANLGVRREVFDALGGFTTDYDYGGPDTEFCWRLQLAGHSLVYAPDAVVHYRHRSTLRSLAVKAFRTGRSRGRLFRDFQQHGMPRPRMLGVLARWARLVVALPAVPLSPRVRWWWVEQASAAAGRVSGSRRFKVLYL